MHMSIPFSIYNRDDTTITRVWNFWIIISLTLSMTLKSLVKLTLIDILSTNKYWLHYMATKILLCSVYHLDYIRVGDSPDIIKMNLSGCSGPPARLHDWWVMSSSLLEAQKRFPDDPDLATGKLCAAYNLCMFLTNCFVDLSNVLIWTTDLPELAARWGLDLGNFDP